jgi:ABC-type transport system substrate-binding protein
MTQRRLFMQAGLGLAGGLAPWRTRTDAPAPTAKVLRVAFPVAETGFDPAQITDGYSNDIAKAIFEPLLAIDFLARPFHLKPLTAEALPIVSSDYRSFTLRVRPGIHFTDDPAFKGVRRELIAEDYVYSFKRHYDLKQAAGYRFLEAAQILGLDALRRRALESKRPFDYDTPVEGLRALDRYTLQIRLAEPAPRFASEGLALGATFGAVAREVVEHYGAAVAEHPVGTGAFKLGEWRRSSRIVLERNPGYREVLYDEQPATDDTAGQAIAARLAGRRLPLVDRVEIAIVEEEQPRWLAFLNREHDIVEVPDEFLPRVAPGSRLAPYLERAGMQMQQTPDLRISIPAMFNMENELVGGYTAEKVALRRAIGLAWDVNEEMRLTRGGVGIAVQSPIAPGTFGYDATLTSTLSEHDPAKARALLDLFGYVDRNGDGWRERPDGRALLLEFSSQPDARSRGLAELWRRSLEGIGLRVVFRLAQWPENLKAMRAGKYMIWHLSYGAASPDSDSIFALAYRTDKGDPRAARFDLAAFNRIYRAQARLPDGPERARALTEASALLIAYLPYRFGVWVSVTDMMQPWVIGYRRNPFASYFRFVDIDMGLRSAHAS